MPYFVVLPPLLFELPFPMVLILLSPTPFVLLLPLLFLLRSPLLFPLLLAPPVVPLLVLLFPLLFELDWSELESVTYSYSVLEAELEE